jgi:hypothetical protein
MSDQEEPPKVSRVPIEWHVPDSIKSVYATNMVVQHAEREFLISFLLTRPPFLVGPLSEEALDSVKSIRAECVAQIIVASERMPGFIKALQTNLETFQANKASLQRGEVED